MTLLLLRLPLARKTKEVMPPAGLAYHSRKGAAVVDAAIEKDYRKRLDMILGKRPDAVIECEGPVPEGIRKRCRSIISGTAEELIRKASRRGLSPPRWELFSLGMYRSMFTARKGEKELPVWVDSRKSLMREIENNIALGSRRMVLMGRVTGRFLSGFCRKAEGMGFTWISFLEVSGRVPLAAIRKAGCTHIRREVMPGDTGIKGFFDDARKLGIRTDAVFFLPEKGAADRARLALRCRPDYLAFRASGRRGRAAGLMGYGMFYSRPWKTTSLRALDIRAILKAIGSK
jgi:hypothetical protein